MHTASYYKNCDFKRQFCLAGNKTINRLIDNGIIEGARCEKYVVANADDEEVLNELLDEADKNGVPLNFSNQLDKTRFKYSHALFSPDTSIIGPHSYMDFLENSAKDTGVVSVFNCVVEKILLRDEFVEIKICNQNYRIHTKIAINCSGLSAGKLAQDREDSVKYCKGSYFSTRDFKSEHLVYPVPNEQGLGTHLTLDLMGNVKFGQNVEWIDSVDYEVDTSAKETFKREISN